MDRPSDSEREALRRYLAAMDPPTRNLHEGVRQSHRILSKKPLSASERRALLAALRARDSLPGALPEEVPALATESHARWVRWVEVAVKAGKLLALAIESGDQFQFYQAQLLENQLPTLKDEIMTPELEMWCHPDGVLELPISAAEFAEMLRVRKSNSYPAKPSTEWDSWLTMTSRYLYQHPTTVEKEMWHEAGHVVVGHRLGWSVVRIDRHPDGTPFAEIPPPCEPPALPVLDYSTVAVAGYLAEDLAQGNAMPSTDHILVSRVFQSSEVRKSRTTSPRTNLAHVFEAEARARVILEAYWDAVGRVAEVALSGLPVGRDALLRALESVPQSRQVCDSSSQLSESRRRRQHSLLTRQGVTVGL